MLLVTVTVNATEAPVSGTDVGLAVLVTEMSTATSVKVTVAVPDSVSSLPSLSEAVAVAVFEWAGPLKSPLTVSVNEQVKLPKPTIEPPVAHVPSPSRSPKSESVRLSRVTDSPVLLVTTTVNVTGAPVSGTDATLGVLLTEIEGSTSLKDTVAVPDSVSVLPSSSLTVAVAVFSCGSPLKSPLTVRLNEQVYVAPAAIVPPVRHVPSPSRSP